MAKKNQAVRHQDPKSTVPVWVWLLLSFALGGIAAGFLIKRDSAQDPFQTQVPKPAENTPVDLSTDNSDQPPAIEPAKPKYDFYTVLAEREVEVKDAELQRRIQEPAKEPVNVAYFVQMGSFPAEGEADGLKAQLALSGVQATISAVKVNGKTWFRVRRGPFKSSAEVEVAKRETAATGVQAIVVREAGP